MIEDALLYGLDIEERHERLVEEHAAAHTRAVSDAIAEAHAQLARGR